MTVDAFAAELVEKLGLLVLPGSVYDVACEGHFRIGPGRTSAGAAISVSIPSWPSSDRAALVFAFP